MGDYVHSTYVYSDDVQVTRKQDELVDAIRSSEHLEIDLNEFKQIKTDLTKYLLTTERDRHLEKARDVVDISASVDRFVTEDGSKYVEDAIDVFVSVYETTSPKYVYGMHQGMREAVGQYTERPVTDEGLANNRLNCPTWLMIFSPPMVEEYGRDWLLNLPADRTEELEDGDILVVAIDDFSDCEFPRDVIGAIEEGLEPLEDEFGQRQ